MDRKRVDEIFLRVRARPAAERAACLDELCGGDAALRAEVEALLAVDRAAEERLRPPARADLEGWFPGAEALVGRRIAGCTLTRRIARGGMGVVYEAEQEEPRRTVAIKIVRAALLDDSARLRFRQEARVLANLRHPAIAQIYAAGTDDAELPYFVMEYVPQARPITAYARTLPLKERLALFCGVCDAVHLGHLKGVVHRDLKPDNILVDAQGNPKIIDFGIAKITDPELAHTQQLTRTGDVIGTLSYLSPEQLASDPALVDARADVYALGVVLYELLAGRLPYGLEGLELLEVVRTIAERQPRFPAAGGDLDVILAKALAKDPAQRYESAAALKADLERFGRGEPIEARPPSMTYRLRLFAHRHRGAVAAGILAAAVLLAGAVVSLTLAARARGQARVAERTAREAERQRALARREAARARGLLLESQKVVGAVIGEVYDRFAALPGSLEPRAFLAGRIQEALDGLALQSGDDPELLRLQGRYYSRLGDLYGLHGSPNLGDTERALRNQEHAMAILEPLPGAALDLARARARAADLHYRRGENERAAGLEREALRALEALPPGDAVQRLRAWVYSNRGERLTALGRIDDAIASYAEAVGILRALREGAGDDPELLIQFSRVRGLQGVTLAQNRKFGEAEVALKEALDLLDRARAVLGSDRTLQNGYAIVYYYWAYWNRFQNRAAEALGFFERSAGYMRRALKAEPGDRRALQNLGDTIDHIGMMRFALGRALVGDAAPEEEAGSDPRRSRGWALVRSAAEAGREAVAIAERLHRADPGNRRYAIGLRYAYAHLAPPLIWLRAWEECEQALRAGVTVAERLMEQAPEEADSFVALGQAHEALATLWFKRGEAAGLPEGRPWYAKAHDRYARAVEVAERALARGLAPQMWKRAAASFRGRIAVCDRRLEKG